MPTERLAGAERKQTDGRARGDADADLEGRMRHLTESEEAEMEKGLCPWCGASDGFLRGPEAGMCTNIKCANPNCGAEFNVGPLTGRLLKEGLPQSASIADLEASGWPYY